MNLLLVLVALGGVLAAALLVRPRTRAIRIASLSAGVVVLVGGVSAGWPVWEAVVGSLGTVGMLYFQLRRGAGLAKKRRARGPGKAGGANDE
jgi:hypothetical protein